MASFVIAHLVWFLSIPAIAIFVALLVFVPGAWLAILAFLRTTFGKVVTIVVATALLSGFAGYEIRGYADGAIAKDVERKRVAAVAGAVIRQARANRRTTEAANQRAEDADERAQDLQEQVDGYVAQLAKRGPDMRCGLTYDDALRMCVIVRGADHTAECARELRRSGAFAEGGNRR